MFNHFLDMKFRVNDLQKPCLVLGKGPSIDRIEELNLDNWFVVCLNHAGLHFPNKFTVIIDDDVLRYDLLQRSRYLCVPYRPHVKFRPVQPAAYDFNPRIFRYDLSTWKGQPIMGPVIQARYNVAEAAFNILAHLGIRKISTLGIDGGKTYGEIFRKNLKPLTNGQSNFNGQLNELRKICKKWKIIWNKL